MHKITRKLLTLLVLASCTLGIQAQGNLQRKGTDRMATNDQLGQIGNNNSFGDEQHGSNRMTWGRDTTKTNDKEVPIGIFQWTIDERLGDVIPAENNDTVVNHYNNFNNTDGYNGEYSYLGNIGSARLSRIFMNREENQPFLFLNPLSFALTPLSEFRFSNTLSPVTNLAYHSAGSDQTGEDRFRAYFASNINKISGFGLKVDYVYGRGYYNASQNSFINGNLFGYYRGEKYEMHAWTQVGHQKNAENGGIEDDKYISDPQSFPQNYGSRDIPTLLAQAYNRNDFQSYHLSHRYYLGYNEPIEVPDSLKPVMPSDDELLKVFKDSTLNVIKSDSVRLALTIDSLKTDWKNKQVAPTRFVAMGSILHTLRIDNLMHNNYSSNTPADYYTNRYFGTLKDAENEADAFRIRNTLGLAMKEGFRKWVKMGITAFATHSYESYKMPTVDADTISGMKKYVENDFSVGGQIEKTQGSFLHYNANGEISILGDHIGAFEVNGTADLNFGISKRDTVQLAANAYYKNLEPDFFMEHYHSQSAWWDNEIKFEQRLRIEGTLTNKRSKTSLRVGFENLTNHSYFAMCNSYIGEEEEKTLLPTDYSHSVRVMQHEEGIQVIGATLKQDFKLGPLNWENELTYQYSSKQDVLPLPTLNVYSNLYLLFRIAKVLRVELGADIRYFTKYMAPDYSPAIGQFATQDVNNPRVEIGNYPIINAFANLHIKHCRIYIAANHVNAGNGHMYLAPHYPINPMSIRWGVSWNFFN